MPAPETRGSYVRASVLGLTVAVLMFMVVAHPVWEYLIRAHAEKLVDAVASSGDLPAVYRWLVVNLGASVVPFLMIGTAYAVTLQHVRRRLSAPDALTRAAASWVGTLQLWSACFFGVGVLWTAIGMREALLHALGGLGQTAEPSVTAFVLMTRLVDGGVLTALTTTIVGGAGAYLMNVLTQLSVTLPVQRLMEARQRGHDAQVLQLLQRLTEARADHGQRGTGP